MIVEDNNNKKQTKTDKHEAPLRNIPFTRNTEFL